MMERQRLKARWDQIQQVVVTAAQMRAIETRMFEAGMPVAALMEKVGGLVAAQVQRLYPPEEFRRVGVLVGPGHNGGDALVVARELDLQGYEVLVYRPLERAKALTTQQGEFVAAAGISILDQSAALQTCDLLIDGLFGFGLERPLEGAIAELIQDINRSSCPVLSIDLPSGLHTDTGLALGTAIQADRTFCLGLWKLGLLQDLALAYVGEAELIDFGIPLQAIEAVLGETPGICRLTPVRAIAQLPLPRPRNTHKYKLGHLLLIGGSSRYAGGIILTGLGARASGVGMLSIAVPASLKPLLVSHLPEALIIGCPETPTGAIAQLPEAVDLSRFEAIACGPGLTTETDTVLRQVLTTSQPLILDADGLNLLAVLGPIPTLKQRSAPTILTPHLGEFRRLFPELGQQEHPATLTRSAAEATGAIVVLKGACTTLADAAGQVWINPESTPALARGGSGDVLTGLIGGLVAQNVPHQRAIAYDQSETIAATVASAVWWHAQAGLYGAQHATELGVDALSLTNFLLPALARFLLA